MVKEKMVAIDARMIKMSGIGVYIQHLVKAGIYNIALGRTDEIEEYDNNLNILKYDAKIYGIKEQLKFPYRKLRKLKPDILHIPHYNVPIFYRGKMVVTIHDLTHLVLPEILPNKFAYLYARVMLWFATHKAEKIFTVSENTKNDIIKYYKVKPEKIIVTYNGVDLSNFKKEEKSKYEYLYKKYSIDEDKKILMYVGNLKPHKNLKRLLEAYKDIDNFGDTVLLLVGKAFDNHNISEIEKVYGIEDKVIHTGMVSNEELVDLYNLADLFVFPSLYEGFGIPPLEAMACGTPVVCSNNSSLPEVVGDAAYTFNPLNVNEIRKAINVVMGDNELRLNYIEKGFSRCSVFKWDECVDKTIHNIGF
jgi:glycosyltransferase involved in cell wall biosynthesis